MKIIPRKRRMEGKTNYLKRKKLLEGGKPRVIVRKTNKYIIIQFVTSEEAQDKIIFSVFSKKLLNYGWPADKIGSLKNLTAAYLIGLAFGKKIKEKGLKEGAILDMGLASNTKGSRIYSTLKGIIDSGYKIACNESIFPNEERIKKGKDFFDKVKENILNEKEIKQTAKEKRKNE